MHCVTRCGATLRQGRTAAVAFSLGAYLDMSNERSVVAPIQGLPKPTRETRKSLPGKGTDAASDGGGNFEAFRSLVGLLLLLSSRPSPGRGARTLVLDPRSSKGGTRDL